MRTIKLTRDRVRGRYFLDETPLDAGDDEPIDMSCGIVCQQPANDNDPNVGLAPRLHIALRSRPDRLRFLLRSRKTIILPFARRLDTARRVA